MTHNPKIRELTKQIEALGPDDRMELFRAVLPLEIDLAPLLELLGQRALRHELEDENMIRIEAEMDRLYDEIRDLVARSAGAPSLRAEIEQKRQQLRSLQEQEAVLMESRAQSRLHLKPGEGYRTLERAAKLLDQ